MGREGWREDERDWGMDIKAEASEGQMTGAAGAYRAYLLRVWRTAEGQWRATLEDAHMGERRAFATAQELAAFLGGDGDEKGTKEGEPGSQGVERDG
jgi:hypothetical protein